MVQTIGNAVYRARVLHGMRHYGIHYDDLELCNGQGMYKNGTSKLQEQLDMLKNHTQNKWNLKPQLTEDEVMVYPNPAFRYVNIACTNAKEVMITDLLGRLLLKDELDITLKENRVDISALQLGVYIYKVIKEDNSVYTGKLIIE